MITVIDNYDSFTWNLVQLIETVTGRKVKVLRNDAFEIDKLLKSRPRALVISPGPGTPSRAGKVLDLIRANTTIPLLGVCLGHQALGEALGGRVIRGSMPVHGKVSAVMHDGQRLFAGCPNPMQASRYHSLILERDSLPGDLIVDAETEDGTIMAVSHRTKPFFGLQFHPESYGTSGGEQLIQNFLKVTR
ncbi:MAG TPA: aminodeoxychorismate/anthranilate synthase component II [Thermoanaerobaculia bacterium]|nr:aminodeoxychorismate/anthranilate synthase component II [Thermoanaerobaculia bacterium]